MDLPQRKNLPHDIPSWAADGSIYFITINALPRGQNTLCRTAAAASIQEAFLFRHARREWHLRLLVLMPDHLHALLSFPPAGNMRDLVAQTKRFLSREAGITWQRGFFDHRLRSEEALQEKAQYIRQNPVRRGLVGSEDEWPYAWSFPSASLPVFGFRSGPKG